VLGFLLADPFVERTRRNGEHFAHGCYLKVCLLREDEAVDVYSSSFAKKAAAFLRNSAWRRRFHKSVPEMLRLAT
jgi:hypothetical protein